MVVTFYVKPIESTIPEDDAIDSAEVPTDPKITRGNIYQLQDRKYIILTINNDDTEKITLASIVDSLGLKLVSAYDNAGQDIKSYPYLDLIVKSKEDNKYSRVSIVIFYNAPVLTHGENLGSSITVNKGEEVGNIGLSFTSKDGSIASVDTMITLDGVRVKRVDTSVAGVYSVTQVARDKLGRTTKVVREVVVLDNEEIKEEVVSEETSTETVSEIVLEEVKQNPIPKPRPANKARVAKTNDTQKNKVEENPQPNPEPAIDNTPVVIQNYTKLGCDVIGGVYKDRANAEKKARKAKSLGYDSYIINRVKAGEQVYYVSYGSRRTLKEANDLAAKIKEKIGGDFYVISR
jgi:cell division septation protein DedD